MNLDIVKEITGASVLRAGEFVSLGFLNCTSSPLMLSFAESPRYLPEIRANDQLSCLICTREVAELLDRDLGVVISDLPRQTFYEFHNWLVRHTEFYRIPRPSQIDPSAIIHPSAVIADHNVIIRKGVYIEPKVVVMPNVTLEDETILRAGVVVGSQGFQIEAIGKKIIPVEHGGGVLIHERVELQTYSNVQRSVFNIDTEIGEETKIDAFVHVGHNVKIGKRCRVAACVMIAGSTTIGDDVWIGPGACLSTFLHIGDKASISLGSVVTKDISPGERVTGNFAIAHDKFIHFIKSIA